jgi:spore coat polysaccharide biosynthesis predicted glycosyltransferase SpsG
VIFDLPEFSPGLLESVEPPQVSVCIDDWNGLLFDCDVVINPNANREFVHRVAPHTRYLQGQSYVILREQFKGLPPRRCEEVASHLFTALGGNDCVNLILRVVHFLKRSAGSLFRKFTVVAGDGFGFQTLSEAVQGDGRFEILHGVEDMGTLFSSSDIGILASGTLLYEAAATGLPSLILSLDEPQAREARFFSAEEAAHYLGPAENLKSEMLTEGLVALTGRERRQRMADRSQSLIDGKGCKRCVDVILERVATKREKYS